MKYKYSKYSALATNTRQRNTPQFKTLAVLIFPPPDGAVLSKTSRIRRVWSLAKIVPAASSSSVLEVLSVI